MAGVFQEENVHVKGKQSAANTQKHLEILKQCGPKSGRGLEIFKQGECIVTPFILNTYYQVCT